MSSSWCFFVYLCLIVVMIVFIQKYSYFDCIPICLPHSSLSGLVVLILVCPQDQKGGPLDLSKLLTLPKPFGCRMFFPKIFGPGLLVGLLMFFGWCSFPCPFWYQTLSQHSSKPGRFRPERVDLMPGLWQGGSHEQRYPAAGLWR